MGAGQASSSVGVPAREKKEREEASKKLVEATEVLKMLDQWRETDKLVKPYKRFFDKATGRLKEKVRKDKVAEVFAARFVLLL